MFRPAIGWLVQCTRKFGQKQRTHAVEYRCDMCEYNVNSNRSATDSFLSVGAIFGCMSHSVR